MGWVAQWSDDFTFKPKVSGSILSQNFFFFSYLGFLFTSYSDSKKIRLWFFQNPRFVNAKKNVLKVGKGGREDVPKVGHKARGRDHQGLESGGGGCNEAPSLTFLSFPFLSFPFLSFPFLSFFPSFPFIPFSPFLSLLSFLVSFLFSSFLVLLFCRSRFVNLLNKT